jgi:hypothetical protein
MGKPTIPMHYVATLEQAWQITRQRPHFWASNCGCRQGRGRCSRSRMDVCLIFTEQDPGSGSGKHAHQRHLLLLRRLLRLFPGTGRGL